LKHLCGWWPSLNCLIAVSIGAFFTVPSWKYEKLVGTNTEWEKENRRRDLWVSCIARLEQIIADCSIKSKHNDWDHFYGCENYER